MAPSDQHSGDELTALRSENARLQARMDALRDLAVHWVTVSFTDGVDPDQQPEAYRFWSERANTYHRAAGYLLDTLALGQVPIGIRARAQASTPGSEGHSPNI